ncbi:YceD family protein [Bacillus sp. 2205SS5-2]|uniref:YceD family protein n=1 Tax=Bacillus sp. 2205SS5-2 TaxID=3109031 RepID=UPI003004182A
MSILKWSTIQLQKFRDKGLHLNDEVVVEEVKDIQPDIRSISPILVTGRADISSEKVTFHLHLTGKMILPCSRTLEDVQFPIDISTNETFLLRPSDYVGSDEEEVHMIQGDLIDLKPVIQELIVLEVPMQVFSDKALEKDLPSGKDWDLVIDENQQYAPDSEQKKVDPRLADLAKFFDKDS